MAQPSPISREEDTFPPLATSQSDVTVHMTRIQRSTATVAVIVAAVLFNVPSTSAVPPNEQESGLRRLPKDLILNIVYCIEEDIPGTVTHLGCTCPAMRDILQDDLRSVQWYRRLDLPMQWAPTEHKTTLNQQAMLYKLADDLSAEDPATIRFVKMMKQDTACQLVARILHRNDMPYRSKARILKALHSVNPDLFSVDKNLIPQEILASLNQTLQGLLQHQEFFELTLSWEDPEAPQLFQELYPDPLLDWIPFPAAMHDTLVLQYHLGLRPDHPEFASNPRPSIEPLIRAIPALARLGIYMNIVDFLYHEELPIEQLHSFMSIHNFFPVLARMVDYKHMLHPEIQPVRWLVRIFIRLLSLRGFVRELELDDNLSTFQRLLRFLHLYDFPLYAEVMSQPIRERPRIAVVMNEAHRQNDQSVIWSRKLARVTASVRHPLQQFGSCLSGGDAEDLELLLH